MKTLISRTKFTIIVFLTFLTFSCSGEDGANGLDGAEGLQGEQGLDGQDGTNGNANVKTGGVTLTANDWLCCESRRLATSETGILSRDTRYVDLNIPEITEEIHMFGLVLVYFTPTEDNSSWTTLPYSFLSAFGDYDFLFETSVNQVRLLHFINPVPADF